MFPGLALGAGALLFQHGIYARRSEALVQDGDLDNKWEIDNEFDDLQTKRAEANSLTSEIFPPAMTPTNTGLITDTGITPSPTSANTTPKFRTVDISSSSAASTRTSHTPAPSNATHPRADEPLSSSAAAGIGIGSTVGGILVMLILGLLLYRHKERTQRQEERACKDLHAGGNDGIEMGRAQSGNELV